MNSLILNIFCLFYITFDVCVECRTYLVTNSRQLRDILKAVSPGDTIQMRDGFYSGQFVANRIGRAVAPIRLVGTKKAILSNNRGTALYVSGQYWLVSGFTVQNSRRGIAVQNGKFNLLERLTIRNIGEEGIALRRDSDDNTIRNCIVTRTGLQMPQYGFGISIGSDERQSYRGYVDRSDRNVITNNRFQTGSPAEAIHAYEGTCCGFIRENEFDGRPVNNNNGLQQYNKCWVSINGNSYRIENNRGQGSGSDGFRVRMSEGMDTTDIDYNDRQSGDNTNTRADSNDNYNNNNDNTNTNYGTQSSSNLFVNRDYNSDDADIEIQGCGNRFRRNNCQMNSNGYCIRVINPGMCRVAIYSDNSVTGRSALTNVPLINL